LNRGNPDATLMGGSLVPEVAMHRSVSALALAGLVAGLALLGACASQVERPIYPELRFSQLPVIEFDVSRIDYVDRYEAPGAPPYVEHLFPQVPEAMAQNWAQHRFQAAGGARSARVILTDAHVTSEALATTMGIEGWFTIDQEEELDARAAVTIEILDDLGGREGYVKAEARLSRTLPENLTLNERDAIAYEMTEQLIMALDAEVEKAIRAHLARYVR
jgi:hypothetical protein